jgi:hypothetical protein
MKTPGQFTASWTLPISAGGGVICNINVETLSQSGR